MLSECSHSPHNASGQLAPLPAATPLVPEIPCSPGASPETGDGACHRPRKVRVGGRPQSPRQCPPCPTLRQPASEACGHVVTTQQQGFCIMQSTLWWALSLLSPLGCIVFSPLTSPQVSSCPWALCCSHGWAQRPWQPPLCLWFFRRCSLSGESPHGRSMHLGKAIFVRPFRSVCTRQVWAGWCISWASSRCVLFSDS